MKAQVITGSKKINMMFLLFLLTLLANLLYFSTGTGDEVLEHASPMASMATEAGH